MNCQKTENDKECKKRVGKERGLVGWFFFLV
jgi:hypothetical protein